MKYLNTYEQMKYKAEPIDFDEPVFYNSSNSELVNKILDNLELLTKYLSLEIDYFEEDENYVINFSNNIRSYEFYLIVDGFNIYLRDIDDKEYKIIKDVEQKLKKIFNL